MVHDTVGKGRERWKEKFESMYYQKSQEQLDLVKCEYSSVNERSRYGTVQGRNIKTCTDFRRPSGYVLRDASPYLITLKQTKVNQGFLALRSEKVWNRRLRARDGHLPNGSSNGGRAPDMKVTNISWEITRVQPQVYTLNKDKRQDGMQK